MDIWTRITEFLICGLLVLPLTLGFGLHNFEIFAVTLGLMQVLLIAVMTGAPTVTAESRESSRQDERKRQHKR